MTATAAKQRSPTDGRILECEWYENHNDILWKQIKIRQAMYV
jgi:hypothetical protein